MELDAEVQEIPKGSTRAQILRLQPEDRPHPNHGEIPRPDGNVATRTNHWSRSPSSLVRQSRSWVGQTLRREVPATKALKPSIELVKVHGV